MRFFSLRTTISSLVYEIFLLIMCVEASLDYGRLRRPGKLMIKNKTLGGSDAPNITSSYRRRTLQVGKLRPPTAGGTSKVCKTLHAHVRMHGHQWVVCRSFSLYTYVCTYMCVLGICYICLFHQLYDYECTVVYCVVYAEYWPIDIRSVASSVLWTCTILASLIRIAALTLLLTFSEKLHSVGLPQLHVCLWTTILSCATHPAGCVCLCCSTVLHLWLACACAGAGVSGGRCPAGSSGEACCSNVWTQAAKRRGCDSRYVRIFTAFYVCDCGCSCSVAIERQPSLGQAKCECEVIWLWEFYNRLMQD